MTLLTRLAELARQDSQSIVATYSPILPGARILEIADDGTTDPVDYRQALQVGLTRDFLAAPERFLRHLFDEDGPS